MAKESLKNQYKVCQTCGEVSAPGISQCPICKKDNFRPMTEEEKNNPMPIIFHTLEHSGRITQAKGCGIFGD